jgi:hypothetical protein
MPFGVIEIVGVVGVGAGGAVLTGGVGDVGVGDDVPPEQAAHVRIAIDKTALRTTASIASTGAQPAVLF